MNGCKRRLSFEPKVQIRTSNELMYKPSIDSMVELAAAGRPPSIIE